MTDCRIRPDSIQPFLKWPGGKRWLVPILAEIIANYRFNTYREPFLGGGALFFALRPKHTVLSDINPELINVYRQVKYHSQKLLKRLRSIPVDQTTYESFRKMKSGRPLDQAVRFLYLNRTAFGGVYRLNQNGEFNVPFGGGGRTTEALWKYRLLSGAASALRSSRLETCDFDDAISQAEPSDLVYCDPTYTVAHNNNGFVRYNERNLSWKDQ